MAEFVAGDAAPDFRLRDATGAWVSLSDFAGSKVILYFYPAALTPGCTVQAIDFSAASQVFKDTGYTILGVSTDEPEVLQEFALRYDLTIVLLSDPAAETTKAYGAWGERLLWGKMMTGLIRSTFIIDVDTEGKGRILDAEYSVRATGHVKRLRASLGL